MNPQELFNLSGRVALVTGASRGIGESIAKLLAASGAHVIVSSRKIDGCQRVADEIKEAGGSAEALACHIGEMDQIEACFKAIEEKHGKLNILINNAAANPYFGHVLDTGLDAFQKTVDVNIRGYFFMSSMGAKLMKKNGGGSIVNVASVNGVNSSLDFAVILAVESLVSNVPSVFCNSVKSAGEMVNKSQPAKAITCSIFLKLAPII